METPTSSPVALLKPTLLLDALNIENPALQSLLAQVHKSGHYGSRESNSYIIALWKGLLAEYFPLRASFTITRSNWATDNRDRRYTVLDVWYHTNKLMLGDVERNRQLLLTVHLCNENELGTHQADIDPPLTDPVKRYCNTAVAGPNGLEKKAEAFFIQVWRLDAKLGKYHPAASESTGVSRMEEGTDAYDLTEDSQRHGLDFAFGWIRRIVTTALDPDLD